VVYRIDRVMQIRDHWPLIVGDAVHDLRSALDHLMWQLAIVYLGRQPKKTEARDIRVRLFDRYQYFLISG